MAALVFDLDGTLIDSAPDLRAAANAMLAEAGRPALSLTQVKAFIGNGVQKLVERCLDASDLPQSERAHHVAVFMRHYEAAPAELTCLYPGVADSLAGLKAAGHRLALCTNKPEAPARHLLTHFGLDPLFEAVIGGDTLAVKKPDPAPLQAALTGLGAQTGLYIGDSEVDAATAQAAGLPFALFTEGYRKTPVDQIPHQFDFDDFQQLEPIVARAVTGMARGAA